MYWDTVLLKMVTPWQGLTVLTDADYGSPGTLESLQAAVRAAFPDATWPFKDAAHQQLDADTVMRIDLGYVESSKTIHVSVDGPGNPLSDLLRFVTANGWAVMDAASGQIIDLRECVWPNSLDPA